MLQAQLVSAEFTRVGKKAIDHTSKTLPCNKPEAVVLFTLFVNESDEDLPGDEVVKIHYFMAHEVGGHIVRKKNVTFKELLNIRIDFTGVTKAEPYILNGMLKLSRKHEIEMEHTIVRMKEIAGILKLFLYNGDKLITELTVVDFLK